MEKINIYQAVNDYLVKWDPINLPQEIARVEYVSYVPGIVEVLTDKDKLCSLLMSFLESIGISQENVDMNLRKEVSLRADELMKLHILGRSHEVFLYIINRPPQKEVCSWYVACDDVKNCACREIRMGEYGEIIAKFDKCGPHSHFTIKDLIQDFCAEIISKGDFEKIWDK